MAGTPTSSVSAGGGAATLFDSTLGADTANIDTGAAGIAGGYSVLEVYIIGYTDNAAAAVNVDVTFNNDAGANYDYPILSGNNVTVAANPSLAATAFSPLFHGNGGSGAYPAVVHIVMPNYAGTTFLKSGEAWAKVLDATAGNVWNAQYAIGYRSTSAISRLKVAGQGGQLLKSGTRLLIQAH